jgi:hypothetical protein
MQEICQSGSEGGAKLTFVPTPISARGFNPGKRSQSNARPERALDSPGSVPRQSLIERHPMFVQQGPKLFFERHLAMMNFLPRNRRDNRLAHLAPFQGDLWETFSPGLKPRAESSCPFGVENPLPKKP